MKVDINGTEVEARQIPFSAIVEPWAEYQLQDGRTVRIKTVLTRLFETDERNADGTPIFHFQYQTIPIVDEKP